jgi:mycofactocin radical SAM maturase
VSARALVEQLKTGLDAPICLTWELTYACNLQCVHCLSSSGQRDPRELTTAEAERVLDELRDLQVFYINIGGGEPMVRRDFFHLVEYAVGNDIGVKFSTNGAFIDADKAARLTAMDYLDVQISLDGLDAATNDAVRGEGSYAMARRAMDNLAAAGWGERNGPFKISIVVTRHNVDQLDGFKALADDYGAQLRVTRLRPSGRGADTWHDLHPTNDQQRQIYRWLLANSDPAADRPVLTGDSFFHLNALGEPLPGLNMCGAGRVVCLIDPIGDVYACPFVIHDEFRAGSVRDTGGFAEVWRNSELFRSLREPQSAGACASCGEFDACQGGCMAAKFFTGLPLDGPDPECVSGHGELLLAGVGSRPSPAMDHTKPVTLLRRRPGSA